jgi:hypothetical protein
MARIRPHHPVPRAVPAAGEARPLRHLPLGPERNLARLRPVPQELSSSFRFVPLPLPAVDGFPDGAECTADIPPEKTELLKVAFDGLTAPFTAFLAEACAAGGEEGHGKKPNWIVVDFAHNWLPPIADEHKARSSPSHSIQ